MHLSSPTPRTKTPRPPGLRTRAQLPSGQELTPYLLAIAIVNSTPPGRCVLERLAQIVSDRAQQQQQQQQSFSNATNILQGPTTTTTAVGQEEQGDESVALFSHREDFSPDRTRSPSPQLAAQRQQQQARGLGLQARISRSNEHTAVATTDRHNSWALRIELLETENAALRRWKLNRLMEEDRARLQDIDMDCEVSSGGESATGTGTGASPCRGSSQTRRGVMVKRNSVRLGKRLVAPSGSTSNSTTTPSAISRRNLVEEGSFVSSAGVTAYQKRHEDATEILEYKHRLLSHLEIIRQNRFLLEQQMPALSEKQSSGVVPRPTTSLWNVSMSSNLVQAVKVATSMFCSPTIRFDVSERVYFQIMDTVLEHMMEPFLTQDQYKSVIQALESSWEQILQPLPILSSAPPSLSSDALPIARLGVITQHLVQQLHDQQQQQLRHKHKQKGVSYLTRCLAGLLRVLLTALIQILDALHIGTPPQHQQQDNDLSSGGGVGRTEKRTRLNGKAQAAARLEEARKSLANRRVERQGHRYLQERACGRMVEIAFDVLNAYRSASTLSLASCEHCHQQGLEGRKSESLEMDVSQDSADNINDYYTSSSRSDSCTICGDDGDQDLQRIEADCNALMSHICSRVLFFPDTAAATETTRNFGAGGGRDGRGIPLWLAERLLRFVSIDCFR